METDKHAGVIFSEWRQKTGRPAFVVSLNATKKGPDLKMEYSNTVYCEDMQCVREILTKHFLDNKD